MYKKGILNSAINRVAGELGHTDCICIADCGLPIPDGVERIDISVKPGLPGLLDVLAEVSQFLAVEKITIASELLEHNPQLCKEIFALFPDIESETIAHNKLKQKSKNCKAVIRTGEASSYANIILQSGCIF